MSEYNNLPSSELENDIRQSMAVSSPSPQFTRALRDRLDSEIDKIVRQPSGRRGKLAWAVPLAVIIFLVTSTLVIGPDRVWAAVRSLLGYLPGVGYVQTGGSLRVLVEPIQMERAEVVLIVEQAAADDERTVVVYKLSGLSFPNLNFQGQSWLDELDPVLRLPDGTILTISSGDESLKKTEYKARFVFPALPQDVNEVMFIIPFVEGLPGGAASGDWEVLLRFEPAGTDMPIKPVYELTTPAASPPDSSVFDHGILYSLDRVVELDDSYLLEGSITWEGLEDIQWIDPSEIILTDANGRQIPARWASPDTDPVPGNRNVWAVQTDSKAYPGPWEISISSIEVFLNTDLSFQIDLGLDPQMDQKWPGDQAFEIGGYSARLSSIKLFQDHDQRIWLEFLFTGDPELTGIDLTDLNNSIVWGISSKAGINENGMLYNAFTYHQIPTGVRTVIISQISFFMDSPWQTTWQPSDETGH